MLRLIAGKQTEPAEVMPFKIALLDPNWSF
jgi:hypothetical protein